MGWPGAVSLTQMLDEGLLFHPGDTQWLAEIVVNHLFATLGCFAADDFSAASLFRTPCVERSDHIVKRCSGRGGPRLKQRGGRRDI